MFILSQDGTPRATANTYQEACFKLQKMQSFSFDYATKHNGWRIDERKYIIDESEPFQGIVLNTITANKISDYKGETFTFEEYKIQPQNEGKELKVIDSEELQELIQKHKSELIQDFKEISEERYWEMLEVLPPMNFNGNYFQLSEAQQYDIRRTFIRINGKFYEAMLPTGKYSDNKEYINKI